MIKLKDPLLVVGISSVEKNLNKEPANLADGLFAIARSLQNIAFALDRLGLNRALSFGNTEQGAIEVLSGEIEKGLYGLSTAISEGLEQIGNSKK